MATEELAPPAVVPSRRSKYREPGALGRFIEEFSHATTFNGVKYGVQRSSDADALMLPPGGQVLMRRRGLWQRRPVEVC